MTSHRRITIDAPNGSTILAARHLDATEGPVQVGSTVDVSTRSAITCVLGYVSKAYRSGSVPASTAPLAAGLPLVQGRCPACGRASLFLGNGGHVTCSITDCPNPSLADEQLHGEQPVKAATDTETTTRVLSALHRSAEQDVTRVIELYEQWVKSGAPPLGVPIARWWDKRLVELRHAIAPPAEQTATKPGPCPSCRRADQAGLAPDEQHPECATTPQPR